MPKLKMLVSMAGADISYMPRDEIEVSDEVAEAWIEAGIAERIGGDADGTETSGGSESSLTSNSKRGKDVSKA